jgi:hydroxymethylglutaryl-CoA reductase
MHTITNANDLLNEHLLAECLMTLTADTKPLWGRMTAQHMVEHVAMMMQYMGGKQTATLVTPEERVPIMKRFLASEKEFQENFVSPLVGEGIPDYMTDSLDAAQAFFWVEWNDLQKFLTTPDVQAMHPIFGMLNREEIIRCNAKHIRHHFKQFGLVS